MEKQQFLELLRQRDANVTQQRMDDRRAAGELRAQIQSGQYSPSVYLELYRKYARLRDFDATVATLQEACERCQPDIELYRLLLFELSESNRLAELVSAVERARRLFPESKHFELIEALYLPVLYDTEAEIDRHRARFSAGLRAVIGRTRLDSPEACQSALDGVSRYLTFYLGYQGRDDRELQSEYGRFLQRIMAAKYPEWVKPLAMPAMAPGEKIRVAYVSAHFRLHSISKLFSGWITERNRDDFEVFVYHNGTTIDPVTEKIRQASDRYVHIPGEFEPLRQAVAADRPHIIVYLDVRHPRMAMMSVLRLAPVQCLAWAFPDTSGSPEIDYFLSCERMEPENGDAHYSERLIRLPGIGVYYPRPVVPRPLLTKARADFGLGEDRVVFLCCQSLFKYLPQHDDVFARIAKRLPAAQFIFLTLRDPIGKIFLERLDRAFGAEGLKAADHCIVHPALQTQDFFNLNVLADVFLDSLEWSGGVTALEAIACRLPIVTLPGQYMRGRHSYGILTQLGVTETIARNKEEYVEIAARLGGDKRWREEVLGRMAAGQERLYWDTRGVRALEDFFRQVVKDRVL